MALAVRNLNRSRLGKRISTDATCKSVEIEAEWVDEESLAIGVFCSMFFNSEGRLKLRSVGNLLRGPARLPSFSCS